MLTEQTQDTGVQIEPVQPEPQQVQQTEPVATQPEPSPVEDNSIEIDGFGRVKVDELKEWKQGYLRQSDYTKKTQEIARQKEEMQDAVKLYEYLRANPHLAQKLAEESKQTPQPIEQTTIQKFDPTMQRISQLEHQLALDKLNNEINTLKTKYTDFDEVKVLTEAQKMGVVDLEFVYKALRNVDENTLRQQIEKETREKILKELQENNINTQTIIGNKDTQPSKSLNITPQEQRVAKGMGLSDEEFVEWRDRK